MSHPTQSIGSPLSLKPWPRSPRAPRTFRNHQLLPLKHPRVCVAASAALMAPCVALAGQGTGLGGLEAPSLQVADSAASQAHHLLPCPQLAFSLPSKWSCLHLRCPSQKPRQRLWSSPSLTSNIKQSPHLTCQLSFPNLSQPHPFLCPHPHPAPHHHHPGPGHHHLS